MQYRLAMIACILALGAAGAATKAWANVDGTLDTSLDPALGSDPFYGVPGLFDYEVNLGGGSPYVNDDTATTTAVQTDGKILVGGYSWNNYLGTDQNACVLARFNVDGSLDSGFGSGGRVAIDFNPSAGENDCYISSVALQGDGKILVAGNIYPTGIGERAYLQRFTASGGQDATFAGGARYVVLGAGTAFSQVLVDTDGSIYAVGRGIQSGFSDYDFLLDVFDANGNSQYVRYAYFDLGADHDDRASAAVLQHIPGGSCGNNCIIEAHTELYLVGTSNNVPYNDMSNHDCSVAAYYSDFSTSFEFVADSTFNGGQLSVNITIGETNEGDNFCRAAVSRTGSGSIVGGHGVFVGGEDYFISTLGGGTPGLASYYALADIDGQGNVRRDDYIGYFQAAPTPGIYNGIWGMAREPNGNIIVTGYASTGDSGRQPSDVGVIRFTPDYVRDLTFGNDGPGVAILSLDGEGGLLAHQREWTNAVAVTNRGDIVLAGLRSVIFGVDEDYDWLVGRLVTSDEIFRDSVDGVVPPIP